MNDCTDLVAKGENTIFKVYACSLKLRRYTDLIFLNMRTPDCVVRHPISTASEGRFQYRSL